MLESDFFKRSRPDFRKLEAFGFQRTSGNNDNGHIYTYSEELPDGQFRAELSVSEDGGIIGRVIDLETNEEYLPIRVENQIGSFSGNVREMYLEFLAKIDCACFVPVHFMFDQANRTEAWINREYGVDVEFPWEKYPGNGTFKCSENGKWFAALLTVEFGKLASGADEADANADGSETATLKHDEEEIVEVINLKADPEKIPALTKIPGVHPAWHMNKKHWISVILDDTLTDAQAFDLIRESYRLVSDGKPTKVKSTGAWMIPSNPKIYDVDAGFRGGRGEIEWHQHNNIKPGDEVYIYSSAPNSAILYRCEVVASDLHYHGMFKESKGYERSMRIRLIEKYPPDKYPLAFIKAHGGSVVRSARSMPKELYEAIKKTR